MRIAFATGVLLLVAVGAAISQQPVATQHRSVLALLTKGQSISVKDAGINYELTMYVGAPQPLGHTVVEVTDDYVVVRDLVGITDTAIPVWSIKAISVVRLRADSMTVPGRP